jgi:hypothetical protein
MPRDEPKPSSVPNTRASSSAAVIKKTIIALAHKLIRTIYVILERRKPYRDSTFDYEVQASPKTPRAESEL